MQTIKVRTTPDEIAKYRIIKEALSIYRAKVDAANEALKAAYKAENIPMSGTLKTPGMFTPKSSKESEGKPKTKSIRKYTDTADALKTANLIMYWKILLFILSIKLFTTG